MYCLYDPKNVAWAQDAGGRWVMTTDFALAARFNSAPEAAARLGHSYYNANLEVRPADEFEKKGEDRVQV